MTAFDFLPFCLPAQNRDCISIIILYLFIQRIVDIKAISRQSTKNNLPTYCNR